MTRHLDPRALSKRDRALLVRVADGTVPERSRARAQRRLHAIADAERLIARQRRVAGALGAGDERVVAAPAPTRVLGRRLLLRVGPAVAALAAVIVLVFVGPSGEPSIVARAADLAKLPATQAAPAADGRVLRAAVGGVPFPDWGAKLHWKATGMRRDELDGRATTTVFYEHTSHRLAYTIVSGPPLPRPDGARIVRRGDREVALYRDPSHGGHDIAVFERGGRTCVVAGHVMSISTLMDLAGWRGPSVRRS